MIKVYTSPDWLLVQTFKSVLESYGIACKVKGEYPIGTRERIAVTDLWVLDDARADEARNILAQADEKDQPIRPTWKCGKCGELLDGQFDQCWHCGSRRPQANP